MNVNKITINTDNGEEVLVDITDSTVTKETLAEGVTAYDKTGEKITGTMKQAVDPKLQEKTVTPTTSQQAVTADSGFDGLSKVTVNAMPAATQATPSISVSSAGLITASATQSAGYVASGTKKATKQLTVQSAKTVTPTTSNQTAVASGRYTTGTITVKGDANLKAENIKSGVSIFGVSGNYVGSTEDLDSIITELENKVATLNTTLDGKASGGASLETCTIVIYSDIDYQVGFTRLNDGQIQTESRYVEGSPLTVDSVLCDSHIWCVGGGYIGWIEVSDNVELIYHESKTAVCKAPSQSTSATITIFED